MRRIALSVRLGRVLLLASSLTFVAQAVAHAQTADATGGASAQLTATPAPVAVEASAPEAAPVDAAPAPAELSAPAELVDEEAREEQRRARALRMGSSYFGQSGGVYVIDAGSGPERSFRMQLMTDFFVKKDYLYKGDKDRYTGGVLSLSVTPLKFLELNAAVTTRTNSNTKTDPQMLSAVGDLHFGVKGFYSFIPGLTAGVDAMASFLNGPGNVGVDFSGTSFNLRASLGIDLREMVDVPLLLRLNVGHYFDQSTEMVQDLEDRRFNNLVKNGLTSATSKHEEYRHLVRRDERLALGINRVDRTTISVGVEAPLEVNDRFAIHPLAEWQLDIPVNRRNFDCPYVTGTNGKKLPGADSCLSDENVDAWPQRAVIGARWYPYLPGLSVLTAVQIGLGGTTNFVQELAPEAPYKILLAVGYAVDAKPKSAKTREVEKRVEVQVAPTMGRVRGTVVEQGAPGVVVANAHVTFRGRELTTLLGGADGRFTSYAFEPGPVEMEIEAEGYQPGDCATNIPVAGGDVDSTCELVALPRVGSINGTIKGADGAPVANVQIALSGPETRSLASDSSGHFREENLPAGDYTLRIEQEGFLISMTQAPVKVRAETPVNITLYPMPKTTQVKVTRDHVQFKGAIYFTTDTADIEPRSEPLLTEIADLLIRTQDILRVEVQGHTDNTGTPEHNLDLSQRRAEAVRTWLVKAGVESGRLSAKGYGADKPIVPNVTPQGRSRNRRVELLILERAPQ